MADRVLARGSRQRWTFTQIFQIRLEENHGNSVILWLPSEGNCILTSLPGAFSPTPEGTGDKQASGPPRLPSSVWFSRLCISPAPACRHTGAPPLLLPLLLACGAVAKILLLRAASEEEKDSSATCLLHHHHYHWTFWFHAKHCQYTCTDNITDSIRCM